MSHKRIPPPIPAYHIRPHVKGVSRKKQRKECKTMDLMTGLFIFYVFCWGVLLCLPEILVFGILAVFWICARLDEKFCRRRHEDHNK